MNVGNGIAIGKLQRSVLLEKPDHARSRFKESVDHRRVEVLAQFMAQIGARLFDVFDDPGPTREWIARHPRPATGPGSGATEYRIFLDNDDFQIMPRGSHGGRQTGGTGTDDQYVAVDIRVFGRHQTTLRQ
ncbi:hypothetical protein D3C81_1577980 [compost metagenome]